jgi:hypothetical protein
MALQGWAVLLHRELTGTHVALLTQAWTTALEDSALELALASVDSDTCTVGDHWAGLAALSAGPAVAAAALVAGLLKHAHQLRRLITSAGGSRQSNKDLETQVRDVVHALPAPPLPSLSQHRLFPALWPRIADAVAERALTRFAGDHAEWRVHSHLALAGYLQIATEIDPSVTARRVNWLAGRSLLGMRAAVTRLPHEYRNERIVDSPAGLQAPRTRGGVQPFTRFLLEVDGSVRRVRTRAGPVSATLNANAVIPQRHAHLSTIVPQIRRAVYTQYDSLILLLLALSSLEHVLRSRMEHVGIAHRRVSDGRPYPVPNWLDRLGLQQALSDLIFDLYDPARSNVRNRVFHSGYLMIDHCLPQVVDAIKATGTYVAGPHFPETASEHVISLLDQLRQLWGPADLAFAWLPIDALTPAEADLLRSLPNDLHAADAVERQEQFRLFVDNVAPTLSTLIKLGSIMTITTPRIEQISALFLVLEGLFRGTCDLLGASTLQIVGADDGAHIHNHMLDEQGLLRDQVMLMLLARLPAGQRANARAVIATLVSFRNRLSHGAVNGISDEHRRLIGKAVVKVAYWLGSVGFAHLVRERAYFHWRTEGTSDEVVNWVRAEGETFGWLRARVQALNTVATP